jgi:hypothetical protein
LHGAPPYGLAGKDLSHSSNRKVLQNPAYPISILSLSFIFLSAMKASGPVGKSGFCKPKIAEINYYNAIAHYPNTSLD